MDIKISDDVRRLGIDKVAVLNVSNLKVRESPEFLHSRIKSTLEEVKEAQGSLARSYKQYRSILEKLGHEATIPAGEKLAELSLKRGFNTINNVIDSYNEAALKYGVGIGGHCITHCGATTSMTVEVNDCDRSIVPLFSKKSKKIKPGDLIYRFGEDVLAWIGKKDVDSDCFRITDDTKNAIFVVLSHEEQDRSFVDCIVNRILNNLKETDKDIDYSIHSVGIA